METNKKVSVISNTEGRIGVQVEQLHFNREWTSKGMIIQVDRTALDELLYDPGFKYMIETGMLYIQDLEVKKQLGLEPEDATEPVNIIVLDEKQKRHYMVTMNLKDFKEKIAELKHEQLQSLADFAINNRLGDMDKSNAIRDICGKDIIRAIQLNDQNKED